TNFIQASTDGSGNYAVQISVSAPTGTAVFFLYDNCIDPNYTDSLGFISSNVTYNFTACTSTPGNCDASFVANPQSPSSLTVDFFPFVQGYSSYDWVFGDGSSSSQPNPTHTYASPGTYTVLLAVYDNATGCTDTTVQSLVVPLNAGGGNCTANFIVTQNGGRSFTFNAFLANPSYSYNWDFGDGNTSTTRIPTHVYAVDSVYDVCLVVLDPATGCTDSFCSLLRVNTPPPSCQIFFFPFQSPNNNLQISFFPSDTNFVNYSWDFGDGNTSTAVSPVHTYSATGLYNICLSVNDGANCTTSWCDTIRIDTLPTLLCDASFGYNTGFFMNGVDFYLLSQVFPGGSTQVIWDFGDGSTGSGPFINHSYVQSGTYTVCAMINDPATGCSDTSCQQVIVNNIGGQNCTAMFFPCPDSADPNLIHFLPLDTTYASYSWDFGDGGTSSSALPTHRYTANGTYNVCLTVDDGNGCIDSFCTVVLVGPVLGPCIADFYAIPDTNGLTVSFSAIFTDPNYTYTWDFGDGNTGSGPNVTHTYASTGTYNVTLSIADSASGCFNSMTQSVNTTPQPPSGNLLFGQVFTASGNLALDVTVYLIQYDSVAGTLTAIDTFVSDPSLGFAGTFFFFAPAGDYLLKAALNPSDPDFASNLPTYYGDVLTWDSAMMVNAAQFPLAFITLKAGSNAGGPGFIGGLISQGAGKNGEGDPMGGMSVMVMNETASRLRTAFRMKTEPTRFQGWLTAPIM
ncbi:MAG: PKD domain-containing protein, partial [Bacteroidia bacterium]